jgi:hypothetical protein
MHKEKKNCHTNCLCQLLRRSDTLKNCSFSKLSILKYVISGDVKYGTLLVLYIKMQKRIEKVFEIISKTSTTATEL